MIIYRYQLGIISLIPLCESLQTLLFTSRSLVISNKPFRLVQLRSSSPFDDMDIKLKLKDMSSDEKDEYIINQASKMKELEETLKSSTMNTTRPKVVKSIEVKSNDDKLVRVPYNKPFIETLEHLKYTRLSPSHTCQYPVGFEDSIESAVEIVLKELPLDDTESGSDPKRPLVISRPERGGKTTALMALCDRLQGAQLGADRVRVMLISFKSSEGFKRRDGETQKQAILRGISQQLVEGTKDELHRLLVDEYALDDYIGAKPFVLLVDQINMILFGQLLDDEAAGLLRRMFLRKNRYLVMSTLIPMGIDDMYSDNKRGYYRIPVPISINLIELKVMSSNCSNLTSLDVAFYGGIPSLIYSVKAQGFSYKDRFHDRNIKRYMSILNNIHYYGTEGSTDNSTGEVSELMLLYSRLINEFITGVPYCASVSGLTPLIELHRKFYQFSYMTASGQLIWPLCYMKCILEVLWIVQSISEAHMSLLSLLNRLSEQVASNKSDKKGRGWKLVLQIGILLNCINCYLNQRVAYPLSEASRPFSLVPQGTKAAAGYIKLPPDVGTAGDAWAYILEKLKDYRGPTIVLVEPAPLVFPLYDMFLIYTPGTAYRQALDTASVRVAGIQAKARPVGMDQPIPAFVNCGSYLAHCHTVKRARGPSTSPEWVDLSEEQVERLLGFSLKIVASIDWTAA